MKNLLFAWLSPRTLCLIAAAFASALAARATEYVGTDDDGLDVYVLDPFVVHGSGDEEEPDFDWDEWDAEYGDIDIDDYWDLQDDIDWLEDYIDDPDNIVSMDEIECQKAIENAKMAKGAYSNQSVPRVGDNVKLSSTEIEAKFHGFDSSKLVGPTGFEAVVYQNEVTGQVTVSFAGTEAGEGLDDIKADVIQALGLDSQQYEDAIGLARHAVETLGDDIQFVGHSLGGGLASAASAIAGIHAETFNSAGVHKNTVEGVDIASLDDQIDAFYVGGEVLSLGQDLTPLPDAAGTRIKIKPSSDLGPLETLKKHGIDSMISSLEENC